MMLKSLSKFSIITLTLVSASSQVHAMNADPILQENQDPKIPTKALPGKATSEPKKSRDVRLGFLQELENPNQNLTESEKLTKLKEMLGDFLQRYRTQNISVKGYADYWISHSKTDFWKALRYNAADLRKRFDQIILGTEGGKAILESIHANQEAFNKTYNPKKEFGKVLDILSQEETPDPLLLDICYDGIINKTFGLEFLDEALMRVQLLHDQKTVDLVIRCLAAYGQFDGFLPSSFVEDYKADIVINLKRLELLLDEEAQALARKKRRTVRALKEKQQQTTNKNPRTQLGKVTVSAKNQATEQAQELLKKDAQETAAIALREAERTAQEAAELNRQLEEERAREEEARRKAEDARAAREHLFALAQTQEKAQKEEREQEARIKEAERLAREAEVRRIEQEARIKEAERLTRENEVRREEQERLAREAEARRVEDEPIIPEILPILNNPEPAEEPAVVVPAPREIVRPAQPAPIPVAEAPAVVAPAPREIARPAQPAPVPVVVEPAVAAPAPREIVRPAQPAPVPVVVEPAVVVPAPREIARPAQPAPIPVVAEPAVAAPAPRVILRSVRQAPVPVVAEPAVAAPAPREILRPAQPVAVSVVEERAVVVPASRGIVRPVQQAPVPVVEKKAVVAPATEKIVRPSITPIARKSPDVAQGPAVKKRGPVPPMPRSFTNKKSSPQPQQPVVAVPQKKKSVSVKKNRAKIQRSRKPIAKRSVARKTITPRLKRAPLKRTKKVTLRKRNIRPVKKTLQRSVKSSRQRKVVSMPRKSSRKN